MLELIAQGRSNDGDRPAPRDRDKTVRNHVANIFNKLQVADRARRSSGPAKPGSGGTTRRTDRRPVGRRKPHRAAARRADCPAGCPVARDTRLMCSGHRSTDTSRRRPHGRIHEGIRWTPSRIRSTPTSPPPTSTNQPSLERYARSLTRDEDAAADICQDVFIRLLVIARAGRMPDVPGAWMHRVAHNVFVSGARRRNTNERTHRGASPSPATLPSTEDAAIGRERDAIVRDVLTGVRPVERKAMVLAPRATGRRDRRSPRSQPGRHADAPLPGPRPAPDAAPVRSTPPDSQPTRSGGFTLDEHMRRAQRG